MRDWLAHVFSSFVYWHRDRLPTIWLLLLFKQIGNPANTALRRPLIRGPEVKSPKVTRCACLERSFRGSVKSFNANTSLVAYSLLRDNKKRRETPKSLFGHRSLKVEVWQVPGKATVTYSPQDFASTTAVVEVTVAICLKSVVGSWPR